MTQTTIKTDSTEIEIHATIEIVKGFSELTEYQLSVLKNQLRNIANSAISDFTNNMTNVYREMKSSINAKA